MSTYTDELNERCISISGVPVKISQDVLVKSIENSANTSGCVISSEIIEGGEIDQLLRKWVIRLDSKHNAEQLHHCTGHAEIQVDGQFYTIVYSPAIECEIPLDWTSSAEDLEVDGDPAPQPSTGSDPYQSGIFENWPPPSDLQQNPHGQGQDPQAAPHGPHVGHNLQNMPHQGQHPSVTPETVPSIPQGHPQGNTPTTGQGQAQGHEVPHQGQGYMGAQHMPQYLPQYSPNFPYMRPPPQAQPPHSESDSSLPQNQQGQRSGPQGQHGGQYMQGQHRGQYPQGQPVGAYEYPYPGYNPYQPFYNRFPGPQPRQPYQPHARAPGYPQGFPMGQQWQQFQGQGRYPNQGQFPNQYYPNQPPAQGQYQSQPHGFAQHPPPTDSTDFSDLPPPYNSKDEATPRSSDSGSSGSSYEIISDRSSTPTDTDTNIKQPIKDTEGVATTQESRAVKDQDDYYERLQRKARAENEPANADKQQTRARTDIHEKVEPPITEKPEKSAGTGIQGKVAFLEEQQIQVGEEHVYTQMEHTKEPEDLDEMQIDLTQKYIVQWGRSNEFDEAEILARGSELEMCRAMKSKQPVKNKQPKKRNATTEPTPGSSSTSTPKRPKTTPVVTQKKQRKPAAPKEDQRESSENQMESGGGNSESDDEYHVPDDEPTYSYGDVGREDNVTNKIIVSGVTESMTEEFLKLFFENRRIQTISDVVMASVDLESETAILEFEDAEAVDIVLQKQPVEALGTRLYVAAYIPQPEPVVPMTTVEVRGLPRNTSTEFVRLYFESGRIGGGDVTDVTVDEEDDVVYVKFEEEDVAKRIVDKTDLQLNNTPLTVQLHVPRKSAASRKKTPVVEQIEEEREEIEVPVPLCTVEIHGIRPIKSKDTLKYYLENKRRSGGGDVVEMTFSETDDDVAFVTFQTEEVAKNVVSKEHSVDNCHLSVRLYIPPPPEKPRPQYDDRVIIQGLQSTTTRDCLFNFLEAKSRALPETLVYGEHDGTVMVIFESSPDFETLRSVCKERKLEGGYLDVSPVPISNCVLVQNLKPTTTQDTVQFYFENSRRSGGGDIDKVVMNQDEEYCLVYFKDHQVLPEVIRRPHKVDGQTLHVQLYLDQLGRSHGDGSEPMINIPSSITVDDIEPQKIKFVYNSEINKDALDKQMGDCYSKILWPEFDKDCDKLVINCTLTVDVADCRKLARDWANMAKQNLDDFLKNVGVHEHKVFTEGWEKVIEGLQGLTITSPNAVAVFVDKEKENIKIIGIKPAAQSVSKDIDGIIKKVHDNCEREKQFIKETISPFKSLKLRMLLAAKYPGKMEEKSPNLKVRINQNRNEITFEGLHGDVRNAQVQMYELVNSFATTVVPDIPAACVTLYQTKQVKDYIVKKVKANHVTGVWDAMDGKLQVCSSAESEISLCAKLVHESVKDQTVAMNADAIPVLSSEQWKAKVEELHAMYTGRSYIVVSQDSTLIHVCTTDDIADEMLDSVKKFLRLNTVNETTVKLHKSVMRLLDVHHSKEIGDIAKQLVQHYVQINYGRDIPGFIVRGTEDGLQLATAQLNKLARQVQHQENTLKQPGIAGYITSAKGQDSINLVESGMPCVIEIKSDNNGEEEEPIYDIIPGDDLAAPPTGDTTQTGVHICATCKVYDDRQVFVAEGDMTEMTVDVIVNTADNKLSLSGGLGGAIVKKGGVEIKQACANYIRTEGSLGEAEVFVCTAGKLKVKLIVHVVGPHWKGGAKKEKEILREAVFKCMEAASQSDAKSIAIPAISCGVFGFPVRSATNVIAGAVKDFFREMQESSLKAVYLCDVKSDTVARFIEGLESEFGREAVTMLPKKSPGSTSMPRPIPPSRSDDEDEELYEEPAEIYKTTRPPPLPAPRKINRENTSPTGKINVRIIKGEMAKLKVDVIVNTAGKNLNLSNGAVSASLLLAGGPGLQQEATRLYPNGIKDGEIAMTSGANLQCGKVIHTALMNWDGGVAALPLLKQVMSSCLMATEKEGASSIAFPAFGTGNLGYPKDIVAKEMYKAIVEFSQKSPNSGIDDVSFVLYHKDLPTIKAFEMEERKLSGGTRTGLRQNRQIEPLYENPNAIDSDTSEDSGNEDDDPYHRPYNTMPAADSGIPTAIGSIAIKIYAGDITKEQVTCIVNSSNDDFDLSRGAVSKALLHICGNQLQKDATAMRRVMKREGVALTSAPRLPCQHIMHVIARDSTTGWQESVRKCLDLAESNGIQSIAFPALGTGIKMAASDIATVMFQTIVDFETTNPKNLTEIRLVIFQKKMVTDFESALQSVTKGKKSKGGFLSKMLSYTAGAFQYIKSKDVAKVPRPVGKKSRQRFSNPNEVVFTVYAMKMDVIQQAIRQLTTAMAKELITKSFKETVIKRLTSDQIAEIKAMAEQNHVSIEVRPESGHIAVTGVAGNIMNASDKIHNVFRDAERLVQQDNEASMMVNLVQWFYIEVTDVGQKLEKYDKRVNYLIERHYQDNKPSVSFKDSSGNVYQLDFANMEEYPENSPVDTVQVIRRDLMKDALFELPADWSQMAKQENLRVITLAPTDKDYIDVSSKFNNTSGGKFTITKIERIQNITLYQQYFAKKKLLDQQNPAGTQNEKLLWHGTTANSVDSINTHGFNRSYCGQNATAFGDGVYFAVQASYSCSNAYSRPDPSGHKRLYYSRALTGVYTMGKSGMRVPPPKGASSHDMYDSVVNSMGSPSMYIIFHDTQAYPEYLVTFKP